MNGTRAEDRSVGKFHPSSEGSEPDEGFLLASDCQESHIGKEVSDAELTYGLRLQGFSIPEVPKEFRKGFVYHELLIGFRYLLPTEPIIGGKYLPIGLSKQSGSELFVELQLNKVSVPTYEIIRLPAVFAFQVFKGVHTFVNGFETFPKELRIRNQEYATLPFGAFPHFIVPCFEFGYYGGA